MNKKISNIKSKKSYVLIKYGQFIVKKGAKEKINPIDKVEKPTTKTRRTYDPLITLKEYIKVNHNPGNNYHPI